MQSFSFETTLTMDEFAQRYAPYIEYEKHSAWDIFHEYTSARVGLHLYPTKSGFIGYYEDGQRTRNGSLQKSKTWVSVKLKEKKGKRIIHGHTFFCPIFSTLILGALTTALLTKEFLSIPILLVISSILFISVCKDENTIIRLIKRLYQ